MDLRKTVCAHLPEGAFLRRDRGDALYVTNAPSKGWSGDIPGFSVELNGNIARVSILPETMTLCCFEGDRLARELVRFKGTSPEAAAIFNECMKCVEAPERILLEKCDRRLRQSAAMALRSGGYDGLYYCALALAEARRRHMLSEGGKNR